MKKTLFWQHPTLPMRIERYECETNVLGGITCQEELEQLIATESDGESQTWGYFPELNPDKSGYPATLELITNFEKNIITVDQLLNKLPLQLAFVRRAVAEPKSKFGGFHVDANAGISHVWPKDVSQSNDVFRLLFNLGDAPRKLEFYPFTLDQLREQGIKIPRDHYEMLNLPDTIQSTSIDIPPMEPDCLYGLTFISTKVPHAGRTTGTGHFLISYGAYINQKQLASAFQK